MLEFPLTVLSLALGAATSLAPATLPVSAEANLSLPAAELVAPHAYAFALRVEEDDSGLGPSADPDTLNGMRGGDGAAGSSIIMNGNVADNSATNVVTGGNTITAGAFANASGVPMVVQNTGANVLIQNATVINLQMR